MVTYRCWTNHGNKVTDPFRTHVSTCVNGGASRSLPGTDRHTHVTTDIRWCSGQRPPGQPRPPDLPAQVPRRGHPVRRDRLQTRSLAELVPQLIPPARQLTALRGGPGGRFPVTRVSQ